MKTENTYLVSYNAESKDFSITPSKGGSTTLVDMYEFVLTNFKYNVHSTKYLMDILVSTGFKVGESFSLNEGEMLFILGHLYSFLFEAHFALIDESMLTERCMKYLVKSDVFIENLEVVNRFVKFSSYYAETKHFNHSTFEKMKELIRGNSYEGLNYFDKMYVLSQFFSLSIDQLCIEIGHEFIGNPNYPDLLVYK